MKVTVDDLSSVKKTLHIEIPGDEVSKELDEAYNTLKKNAKIKGFRPGKAPRSVLERLFKKDVHADITSKLIQGSFIDALKETELNIIGTPQIDPPEIQPGSPYLYDASVEIRPEIGHIDFEGVELKKTLYTVENEEMETQLKMLRKNLAQRVPIEEDRPVQDGDFVIIDYEGFKEGKPFEETQKTENITLQVGKGTISKEFDDNLVGMKPGDDKEFTVTFPEDHLNQALAGLELTFTTHLNEIREENLPDLDDEFAKRLGDYQTLDDLKKAISDNLKEGYEKRVEHELNEQIFTSLIEKTDFEVPDSLVDMELDGILREAERSFEMRGMTLEEAGVNKESLSEKHRDTAEKQVRRHLILNQIVKQEELSLSDEALEKGFEEMALASRQPIENIKKYYEENADGLDFFKHTLLEKQAISLIMEKGIIEEVEKDTEQPSPEKKD